MKRTLSIVLVILIMICSVLSFSSCKKDKIPDIPLGYQFFPYYNVSFAYPSDWFVAQQDGVVVVMNPTGKGTNITFSYEIKTTLYENTTPDEFYELMKPNYEAVGGEISNVQIEKKTTNNIDVVCITYDTLMENGPMKQHLFVTTYEDLTYSVTVTVVGDDDSIVDTVFSTLHIRSTWDMIKDLL